MCHFRTQENKDFTFSSNRILIQMEKFQGYLEFDGARQQSFLYPLFFRDYIYVIIEIIGMPQIFVQILSGNNQTILFVHSQN